MIGTPRKGICLSRLSLAKGNIEPQARTLHGSTPGLGCQEGTAQDKGVARTADVKFLLEVQSLVARRGKGEVE